MTVKMEIQREGLAVEVECDVECGVDPRQESVDPWAQHRNGFYMLTPEEKAFALNLALEKLHQQGTK